MKQSFFAKLRKMDIVKNFGAYLLLMPAVILVIVFAYLPMIGLIISFQNYDPMLGMFKSEFVWFENFVFFFKSTAWIEVTVNTLFLNTMFIITGTIASVIIAIILSELTKSIFLKISQTLMTLPNFVSWSTIALFSVAFFSIDGIINNFGAAFNLPAINFYANPDVWPLTFILIRIWKSAGWSAIIFMAAILGIDKELYESAKIDGANRVVCIFTITLPLIKNTIIIMTIMAVGNIFKGDFGMIYPFVGDNAMLYATTNVIDTYVFRALRTFTSYGRTAAIGLFQSIMGFGMVMLSNFLARRYSPDAALF